MNKLDAIDNRLNNATCPKLIESLIYERKAVDVDWKETAKVVKEQHDKIEEAKRRGEDWLERLRRLMR